MIDSAIFGHQWSTVEGHAIFDETARVARWRDIIISLAESQAECGVIPGEAAEAIARLRDVDLSITDIARRTRETSHSTLGMIHVLRDHLPASAAEFVYFGTTVQDISDTAQVLELRAVSSLLWRDLRALEDDLLQLAIQHRSTPMAGRTHGQPGAPITFGFKVASWADEVGRHLQRLDEGRKRWLVAQLGGAVGTLGFFGERAMDLRAVFCRRMNLDEPTIAWLSSRDRFAEFIQLLAVCTSSLARIANEVYNLQRLEIGELAERTQATTVGSITMPHKRNPEVSEQIVTLAQLVRAQASVMNDTMVQEHERDGRGWKAEWTVFPQACHCALSAASMARELIAGLEVNSEAMFRNLGGSLSSEQLLSLLSTKLGKHKAQEVLQHAYRQAREHNRPFDASLDLSPDLSLSDTELDACSRVDIGASHQMIDRVVECARERRSHEPEHWV